MEGQEFRSRHGRIVIADAGVMVMESGTQPHFVPWYAVGHMQSVELGGGVARARFVRMHLADGRVVTLPAPSGGRGGDANFDHAAAEVFRRRTHGLQDEIPTEYRAEVARMLDPIQDAAPRDAVSSLGHPVQDAVPSAGDSILRRWIRRRGGR